jgi:ankyrin repeat protein
MKYIKLFEAFKPHDPYELMIIPPNKKAEMIVDEIKKGEPNLNLVNDLIVLGANLDWQDEDKYGWTPLHYAIDCGEVEIARMLIEAGADVNVQNEWGKTPLHRAAMRGRVEIVGMLLDARVDVNLQDKGGWTPLHVVASNGRVEIARMLIDAGADKDIRDNVGNLPYDLADTEELKNLLKPNLSESFDSYDPYELMIIPPNKKVEMIVRECEKSNPNLDLISDLITLGANLNWQDEDNYNFTPLHVAANRGKVEIARMLIDAGANLNVQNEWDGTPLLVAIRWDKVEIARMLIDAGADLDVQEKGGWTPLHWAAGRGQVEIARMLIDAGAKKDIEDNEGRTPYDLTTNEELKKLLKP